MKSNKLELGLAGVVLVGLALLLVAILSVQPGISQGLSGQPVTPAQLQNLPWTFIVPQKFGGTATYTLTGQNIVANPFKTSMGAHVEQDLTIQNAASVSTLEIIRANGTFASPSILVNNDVIGRVRWRGAIGAGPLALSTAADLSGEVDGSFEPGTAIIPGRLIFRTGTRDGTGLIETMRLDSDGLKRPGSFKTVDYSPVDVASAPGFINVPVGSSRLVLRGFQVRTNSSSWRFSICQSANDPSSCFYGISGGMTGWAGDYADFEANRFYVDKDGGSSVHFFIDPEGKPEAFRFLLNVEVQ